MQIKIATTILGLVLPWLPTPLPIATDPGPGIPRSAYKKIEPIKQSELTAKEPLSKVPMASSVSSHTPQAYSIPVGDAKAFIYAHESGNNPLARNASGCLGLGQACPGEKLLVACPTLDYACEDAYFTGYALSKYGSWENARAFWLAHGWW